VLRHFDDFGRNVKVTPATLTPPDNSATAALGFATAFWALRCHARQQEACSSPKNCIAVTPTSLSRFRCGDQGFGWFTVERIVIAFIIADMSSGGNAETWLDKGSEAYAQMRIAEAGQDFEKAVAADPHSAGAHLSLGVIRLFQYQNGIGEARDEMDLAGDGHRPTREQWQARAEKRRALVAEQNAGNAANAEQHLRRAVELKVRNQPSIEYLAALYYAILDPATEGRARLYDAKLWYRRLLEINPQHPFANYMCGVIDYQTAFPTIRSNAGFPSPLTDDSRCRSLRAQTGPLLTESARNFLRSLEIDPKSTQAMIYLMLVKRDQAYIAETENEVVRNRAEADALEHKVYEIMDANAKANSQPWPPGNTASVTFVRVPRWSTGGKPPVPRFPPDARLMTVPLAPPPPPPPPSSARR